MQTQVILEFTGQIQGVILEHSKCLMVILILSMFHLSSMLDVDSKLLLSQITIQPHIRFM